MENQEKPPSGIPEPNIALYVECRIIKNVIVSAMEVEMGDQFINWKTGEYLQTILTQMEHPQPDTLVATGNSMTCVVGNVKSKQLLSR